MVTRLTNFSVPEKAAAAGCVPCPRMHQECSALKWSNLAIDRKPIYWVPHAVQTASLNLLGRVEEARTAAQLLKQV